MFEQNRNSDEAALYYLYMLADSEISYSEEKVFNKICDELNIDAENKNSIIKKCKELASGKSDIFSVIVREKIDEQAALGLFGLPRSQDSRARIIWNLINLGYADSFYSEPERKIVAYLVDKWSLKEEIYQEFMDIADTILALSQQREWVISTFPKGTDRDSKEKKLDDEINQLLGDVYLTIEELTM